MGEGGWELGALNMVCLLESLNYKGGKIEPGLEGSNWFGRRREREGMYVDFM